MVKRTSLGERAKNASGFFWMVGMTTTDGRTVVEIDPDNNVIVAGNGTESVHRSLDAFPDVSKPGTQGCLLELIRTHKEDPTWQPSASRSYFYTGRGRPQHMPKYTYAEALVTVLEEC